MNRWLTSLGLLIILSLGLAACGQTPTTASATSVPAATNAPAADQPTSAAVATGSADKIFKVGIVQQITHPALDAAREGAKKALAESGLKIELIEKNAQNDVPALTSIAEGFRDQQVDLVIAIGTLPLQSAYKVLKDSGIPIVFNAVTDPYKAGVATSETEHPGVTGVQALPPVPQAFDLITVLRPEAKRVGNIWTSTEKNSEIATGLARDYAKTKGIEFIDRQVTKADEVLAAAESLASEQVDAIFISTDSTVVSTLESVIKVANENKIALVCNDPASAQRGCAAALGLDYSDNGYQSAALAIAILKGEKTVDQIPITMQMNNIIALNTAAAQQQGVTFPDTLKSAAKQTYDTMTPPK
jgi:putative tryptophan/tyrosine transport system substrate-binding protein